MAIQDISIKKPIDILKAEAQQPEEAEQLSPPVTPNEYYPGYNAELTTYGAKVYKSYKDIGTITEKRKLLKLPTQMNRLSQELTNPDMLKSMSELKSNFQQYQADIDSSLVSVSNDEWRYSILATLPALMITNGAAGEGIDSADYVSNLFPNKNATQEDLDWLQDTFSKLEYMKPKLPEGYNPDMSMEEMSQKMLASAQAEISKPDRPLRALSTMTGEEIAKYTSSFRAEPEQTGGMTAQEYNALLSYMSMTEEDKISVYDFISTNMTQWKTESNFIELTRKGLLEAKSPEMLPTDFLKAIVIAPMAATSQLLNKIYDYTVRPAVSASVIGTHRILESVLPDFAKDTDAEALEQLYLKNVADGTNIFAALSGAYNDWDMPGWYKFLAETSFDPTTWLGLGVYAKTVDMGAINILKLVGKGDKLVIPSNTFFSSNMATRVGTKIMSVENGIQNAMNVPFVKLASAVNKIPRTTTQLSKDFARTTSQLFNAVVMRNNNTLTSASKMTLIDIDNAVKIVKDNMFKQNEGGSMYSTLAKHMGEFEYLTEKTVKEKFGKLADGVNFDTKVLADINGDLIDIVEGNFTDKIVAGSLLSRIGKDATNPDVLKEMLNFVKKFKSDILSNIDSMTAGKTVKDRLINMFDTLKNTRHTNLSHPVSQYWNIAGRKVGWISTKSDAILHSAVLTNLEKYTTTPYARMQLLFVNFGPWNYVDNAFRSFFGGGRLVVPSDYTGLIDMEVKYGNTAAYPIEASWIERRHRDSSATFGIAAGNREKSLYDKGIPLVTKDLYNSKGEIMGKSITYRGQTYTVSSMEGWNRIWDDQTDIQRYLNMEVCIDKKLAEIAPEKVGEITSIMSDLAPDLKAIKSFDAGDIPGLDRRHFAYAANSSEMFRTLQDITTTQLARNIMIKQLARSLKSNANVPSGVKQYMRDGITDGSFLKDLAKSRENVIAMCRDQNIAQLQVQEDLLKKQVERFIKDGAPNDISEFRNDIANVTNVFAAVRDRMHEYRATVELRKAALPLGRERDLFEEGSAKVLSNFIKTSSDQLTTYINQLKNNVAGLEPVVQVELNAFGNVYLERVKLNADLREDLLKIESKISSTPMKKRDDRFWNQIGDAKNKIWSAHETASYDVDSRTLLAQRNFMDAIGEKPFIPQAVDPVQKGILTVHNLAQLFGATGDEAVSRLLTTVTSQVIVRPRQSFIVYVRDQANAYAKARLGIGKTASDAGFTDEAIGGLYDSLWERLGIQKSAVQVDTVQLQEIDNIFKEIDTLYAGVKVPESDVLKYKDYVKKFADRLEQTSMYRPIKDLPLSGCNPDLNQQLNIRFAELTKNVPVPGMKGSQADLFSQTNKWLHQTDNEALQNIGKAASANPEYLSKMRAILKEQYPSGKIRIFRGTGAAKIKNLDPLNREYVSVTSDRETAIKFEDTWIGIDPTPSTKPSLDDIVINIEDVLSVGQVGESELIISSKVLKDRISNPLPMPKEGEASWLANKDRASKLGLEQHYMDFPDYTQQNFIDESMKQIFPFWCVPDNTKILTKSGWKNRVALSIGELVLTMNHSTMNTEWQPVKDIAVFNYDSDIMVIPAKGKDIKFTPNHRWYTFSDRDHKLKEKRGYQLTDTYDMIPRSLPHEFPTYSILSPRLSEVLGWIVTEGYLNSPRTQRPYFIIYQSSKNYVNDIEACTGSKAYSRSKINDPYNMVIRVSADDTEEILKVYSCKDDLPLLVTKLSRESTESMWRAMSLAESNYDTAYNGKIFHTFLQNPGPVSDSYQMLCLLLGKAITIGLRSDGIEETYIINNTKPFQAKQCRRMYNEHYKGKVWCPVTDNGTWIANFNGSVLPTGNTYETFRWRWMPRTFLRTPGTFTAMARWNENTDNGYVPVPGTDWDMNLLRGTTMMGGLRSFYSKDSPSFYNRYPGLEMFEKLSRYGFFPGLPVQGTMTLLGAYGRKNWGELLPPWVTTPLSALRELSPNNLGPIIDEVFPESYADYRTSMILASEGHDANALWKKKYNEETMTPEEQKLWNSAAASANGIRRVFEEQIGLMRLRTDEYNKYKENWKLAIEEMTGVSVQVQDQIDKMYPITGKRFADYYPLDVYQQKLLYTYEDFRNWQGLATPMYPSSWTNMEIKISDYYDEVDKINQQFRHNNQYNEAGKVESYSEDSIDEQFRTGIINGSQWVSSMSSIESSRYKSVEALQNSSAYSGIPLSYEDRVKWMEEKGEIVPTLGPSQELLYYYYELKPAQKWNTESGKYESDWDTYYAHVDNLLSSLEPAYRDRLLKRIQFEWSDMRRLYWKVSRDFIQPYNQIRDVVISSYDKDSQYWINAYMRADTTEQNRIEQFNLPDGHKLISDFNSKLSAVHESMRMSDPELDAWLNFFGKVTSFKTKDAETKYTALRSKYTTIPATK
jgi:hypothetical protein